MKTPLAGLFAFLCLNAAFAAPALEVLSAADPHAVVLASPAATATIAVDPHDYPVVSLAAGFFADDVARVSGHRPTIAAAPRGAQVVIAGTLGHSALIDGLVSAGKLTGLDDLKGQWETTRWQVVEQPAPGVERALVIVGSDRRGTAYGLMTLSEKIGVSPWYWWSDVPARHRDTVAVRVAGAQTDAPAVKYRGIFINDEDWGLQPWAAKTFDPQFGNIGPKTYQKVFELLLRLRLNYLWPAMHACSAEFASQSENAKLADQYAIVAGSSHCEPMLCNNVHWNERKQGKWDYTLNRDAIRNYWAESAKTRGSEEAVWTLGIRGIHDRAMEGPKPIPTRIKIVSQVIQDQRALIDEEVSKQWGPVAQAFVPYKEVLPIYDAGLKVPDDVTLVWVDDNFGYIRRLSAPAERQRSGGAGVYWHLSYYGGPHSYTWVNTTAPGLIWEELHKAWDNDARLLWVINVGDIKPMEIGIDYYARLAWNAPQVGADSQPAFLRDFAARNFGDDLAPQIADFLTEYYRLGTIRKPELMVRSWALSLSPERASTLRAAYDNLLRRELALAARIPAAARDAYTETIGFPAQVLGCTGLIFMADRAIQLGQNRAANEQVIAQCRAQLEAGVQHFNTGIADGKWNHMMPGLVTGQNLMAWNSQVRWPWGEKPSAPGGAAAPAVDELPNGQRWRAAASGEANTAAGAAKWTAVAGLGGSGHAMALEPAALSSSWKPDDASAPTLAYAFEASGSDAAATIDFLPTFRIYPGMKLRVAVAVDDQPATIVEVPGSSGIEDERGAVRQAAVQDNYVRAEVPLPGLAAGHHTLKIRAIDPGVAIDRVAAP